MGAEKPHSITSTMKTFAPRRRDVALGVEYPLRSADRGQARGPQPICAAALILLVLGSWQFGQGAYIHAKAWLAQALLSRAWERTLSGATAVKPWSWADTWPVARLTVPRHGVELFVLAGANGRTIAFGPGHVFGTPLPGEPGNSVIGAHRDTHFRFLRKLRPGDEVRIERSDGAWRAYRVSSLQVTDKTDVSVLNQDADTRLTLITCYPFDGLRAGGSLRYVVEAAASS